MTPCATVDMWSGGDLFIKVYPGVAQPVDYTLGVEVKPPTDVVSGPDMISPKVMHY